MCWEGARGRHGFVFWMCAHAIHMQSCEKMRYMRMAEGRHFLQRPGRDWSCWQFGECASITQQLWAVLVQATGLKRAVVSSRLPLPIPPPLPPLKMCHLNKLTSVSGSILPGVARGLWKGCQCCYQISVPRIRAVSKHFTPNLYHSTVLDHLANLLLCFTTCLIVWLL